MKNKMFFFPDTPVYSPQSPLCLVNSAAFPKLPASARTSTTKILQSPICSGVANSGFIWHDGKKEWTPLSYFLSMTKITCLLYKSSRPTLNLGLLYIHTSMLYF